MGSPFAITDPLSAGKADRRSVARDRLRRTGSALYAAAALTQLAVLFAPDPDPSDHAGPGGRRRDLRAGRDRPLPVAAPAAGRAARDQPAGHRDHDRRGGRRQARRADVDVLPAAADPGRVLPRPARGAGEPRARGRRLRARTDAVRRAGAPLGLVRGRPVDRRRRQLGDPGPHRARRRARAAPRGPGDLRPAHGRPEPPAVQRAPGHRDGPRRPQRRRLRRRDDRPRQLQGPQRRPGACGGRRGAGALRRARPRRQAPRRPLRPRGRRGVHGDPRGHRRRLGRDLRRQPARAARRRPAAGHDQRRHRGHRGVGRVGRDADGRRRPRAVPRQARRARPRRARRATRAAARPRLACSP